MQVDKNPFFRKPFTPWYASDAACVIKALMMLAIVLFAIDGIKIARQVEAYNAYIWIPVLLFALSAVVFAINLIQILKRFSGDSTL